MYSPSEEFIFVDLRTSWIIFQEIGSGSGEEVEYGGDCGWECRGDVEVLNNNDNSHFNVDFEEKNDNFDEMCL